MLPKRTVARKEASGGKGGKQLLVGEGSFLRDQRRRPAIRREEKRSSSEATERGDVTKSPGTHSPPSDYCIQHNLRHCLRSTSHRRRHINITCTGGRRDVHSTLNNPRQPFLPGVITGGVACGDLLPTGRGLR